MSFRLIHSDFDWGTQVNGHWTGLIGAVTDGSAHMAVGELSANPDRIRVVDFTIPYYYSDVTFFSRNAKLSAVNASSLLVEAFGKMIWVCLSLSILFSVLLMKIARQQACQVTRVICRALLHQCK